MTIDDYSAILSVFMALVLFCGGVAFAAIFTAILAELRQTDRD